MQHVLYFAIATVTTMCLSVTALLLMWKQLKTQGQTIQTLTNMAASKNLETFQRLQATTNLPQQSEPEEKQPYPMTDELEAQMLAERYRKHGLDPSRAFASTDDEWLSDFGGPEAFRTN